MNTKQSFSFFRGYKQVPNGKLKEVRVKIMNAIGIVGESAFYRRLRGEVEPKISEARAIEAIFAEYGITDIWGES